jgi:serine/threonine-protein kinase
VAVKRLLPHLAGDPAAAERFAREARAAAKLSHPGIVTVFDTGQDSDGPYIVLELVTGATIADQLAETGPMRPSDVASVVTQVAAALDHAHANGVIHRDIKPANLIVDSDSRVRLADFGIARLADDRATLTGSGELIGTISYLAPEILAGDPATAAADIYALGAVTYEMLLGRPPFSADSPAALLDAIRGGGVPSLDGLAPDQMSVAVREAVDRDPEARPVTAGRFAASLTGSTTLVMPAPPQASVAVASEEPTVVGPVPPPPPPRAPVVPAQPASRRWSAWPLVLLMVTIVALAAAAMSNGQREDPNQGVSATTTVPATTAPSTVATTVAATTTLPPTTTIPPTTTTIPTAESVAGEIGLLLASLEPPTFQNGDVRQVDERVESAIEEWQAEDRDDLRRELERAFDEAADLEESSERTLLIDRLAQLAELMGFRVDRIGELEGNGGGDGND